MHITKLKKPMGRELCMYDFKYMTFLKRQNSFQ